MIRNRQIIIALLSLMNLVPFCTAVFGLASESATPCSTCFPSSPLVRPVAILRISGWPLLMCSSRQLDALQLVFAGHRVGAGARHATVRRKPIEPEEPAGQVPSRRLSLGPMRGAATLAAEPRLPGPHSPAAVPRRRAVLGSERCSLSICIYLPSLGLPCSRPATIRQPASAMILTASQPTVPPLAVLGR